MEPLRVLYVHHAGPFGGASRSLYELIRAFPDGSVRPLVLTRHGQFLSILKAAGIEVLGCRGVSQFDNTRYGHYRGARWLILLREIAYLPTTLLGLLAARRCWGRVDLVHINDLTLVPAIWLAKLLFRCPVVVHIRSVQMPLTGWRGCLLRAVFSRNADRFIAIDETVRRSVDVSLEPVVIHNGLSIAARHSKSHAVSEDMFTVGMVGGLSRAKGCLEFVEAAKFCCDQRGGIRFVFVGQSMRPRSRLRDVVLGLLGLSQEIEEELRTRIAIWSLQSAVEFWPFTLELDKVYGKLDAICFPSYFDAPGRPIFEAALFGVPSIAAISNPTADTIVDGLTGIIVSPRDPKQLAQAIQSLAADREKCRAMGENARKLALDHFDIEKNSRRVFALYRALALLPEGSRTG